MIKKIMHLISNCIFVILIIFLAISFYSWFQINVLKKSYSSFLGYSIFEVVTGSMSGTIEINDYIIVKETENIGLKDIITFKDKDSLVTHRIVQIVGDNYVTKGDANNSEDVTISKKDVIGKVVYVIPNGAVWKKVFMDKKVLVLIFITMGIFTIYFSIDEKKEKNINISEEEKEETVMKEPLAEVKIIEIKSPKNKKKNNTHYPGKREYYKNKKRKSNNETK